MRAEDGKKLRLQTSASRSGRSPGAGSFRGARLVRALRLGLLLLLCGATSSAAAPPAFRRARQLEAAELGISQPAGLAWSRKAGSFLVLPGPGAATELAWIGHGEERIGTQALGVALPDAGSVAFDNKAHRLLAFDARGRQLIEIRADAVGVPDPATLTHIPARQLGIREARGMAVDPVTGRLFLLDGPTGRIAVVEPDRRGNLQRGSVAQLELGSLGRGALRGLAFDPESGHLHVYRSADATLFEIDPSSGDVVAARDLSSAALRDSRAMLFAPSGDQTDAPGATSLYVVEGGAGAGSGGIVELAMTASALPQAASPSAVLVQVIDTSLFSPPSPDPMGITYLGDSGTLLLSDSELEEIPTLFTGENLFRIDPVGGGLIGTSTTMPWSEEPTGLAWDPATGHVFMSDDDADEVFEIDPGSDGLHGTPDDSITSFDTRIIGSSLDPEGIAYDFVGNRLYIADGLNSEVYQIDPGPNGLFDGIPPVGDDTFSSFDTSIFGALDPEGIAYDSDNGFLYLTGTSATTVYHVTTTGSLIRTLDISAAGASNPAGLEFAASSPDPLVNGLYIADRGVDNDSEADENDGRIFEVAVPPLTPGNLPPQVDAGPDLALLLPAVAVLDATVSDPLVPAGTLVIEWSQLSGPGNVDFADPLAEDTTASFFAAGTYVLRLTVDDGELFVAADVVVSVTGSVGEQVAQIAIAAGSDDAEQYQSSGNVSLGSSDIELTFDNGGHQTVGLRFQGVPVPRFASVLDAFVQFTVDEPNTGATVLTIQGESDDAATTFVSVPFDISSRPRTLAEVVWLPPPWPDRDVSTPDQRTPNLAPIIEEIVSRPEWSAGNALALIVRGTGERTAIAYEKDPARVAVLHIIYVSSANGPPAVSIASPPEGAGYQEGTVISFAGSASDAEDGDLGASLVWTSSPDGPIGIGSSFERSDLSPGQHTIRASVTDSGGLEDWLERSIVVNGAPFVTISLPADGASFTEGAPIAFAGAASDPEDGDLTPGLVWTSSLDGPIGTGGSFLRSDLQPGLHVIYAVVTDSGDFAGESQITLSITPNTAPGVTLSAPSGGADFALGEPIDFAALAADLEDGDLSASLSWSSSLDGPIGSGASFSRADLSAGLHTVTASAIDSGGLAGFAEAAFSVGCPGPDGDGDGVPDSCDNCSAAPNPAQLDSNGDGFGNACDPDYNGDGMVGLPDYGMLAALLGSSCGDPGWDPDLDANDDCAIGLPDLSALLQLLGQPPGPSGTHP